jgi:cell division protein FtsB
VAKYKNNSFKKFLSTGIGMILLLLILGFIVYSIYQNLQQDKNIANRTDSLDQEINRLEEENLELTNLIEYFASSEYIEKEAREKLNLAKPGEKVVIISKENILLSGDKKDFNQEAGFKVWWNYFFE